MHTIAIVGGGAAGLAAAIAAGNALEHAARRGNRIEAEIVIYEGDERVGRSILRSGNGRCNYTNSHITSYGIHVPRDRHARRDGKAPTEPAFHNEDFVNSALACLEMRDDAYRGNRSLASNEQGNAAFFLFEDLGMMHREEDDGRCYPLTGKASTVLNLMRNACARLGVRIECGVPIRRIEAVRVESAAALPGEASQGSDEQSGPSGAPNHFLLHARDKRIFHADQVIIATGGMTARAMLDGDLPLRYTKPTPILAPLALRELGDARRMDNVRLRGDVSLLRNGELVALERGEVLFRKYGISGIAVFNLSRYAQPGDTLRIQPIVDMDEDELVAALMTMRKRINTRVGVQPTCEDILRGVLHEQIADVVLSRARLDAKAVAGKDAIARIASVVTNFDFTVEGIGDEKLAQVHRGGFEVGGETGVSPSDMTVPSMPRLRIVGEALDVDGPCGGYNLHWAWSSGMLAGYAAAEALLG